MTKDFVSIMDLMPEIFKLAKRDITDFLMFAATIHGVTCISIIYKPRIAVKNNFCL
jgi:hypothetical protein